jgi:hypothetical protein
MSLEQKTYQGLNKKGKFTTFLKPLYDMYTAQVPIGDFWLNLLNVKKQLLINEKIIKKYYPDYLEEFRDSNMYQQIADTLDYHKDDIKNYKLKQTLITNAKNALNKENTSLNTFYRFFDDKSFKLEKDVYFEIRKLVSENGKISLKRLTDLFPSVNPLFLWLSENYL